MTKIKAFFKKWIINNIGYKIAAVIFAFILWLIILNVTDPDATKTISNIAVTIENEDAVLDGTCIYEIVSGKTTSITVSGSRSIISGLSSEDFIASVDFEELSTENTVLISVELTGDMSKYSSKVDITVKTTTMVINIDEITTLKVPVEVKFTGESSDNETIDSVSVTPEYVTVTAPQSVLDTVDSVVAYVDYSDIDDDTSVRSQIGIYDAEGNEVDLGSYGSVDCSSVLVEVDASYTKTVSIYMEDPDDTTADGYEFASLQYSMVTVTIKGSRDIIESIDTIEIPSALLDLTDATSNVSVSVYIADYLPEDVIVYGDSSKVVITAVVTESETTTAQETEEETTQETSQDESSETTQQTTGEEESEQ